MSANFTTNFRKLAVERFPEFKSIAGVFAVIVFVLYSRMLYVSFLKLPSWLYYLTIWQILSVYAYGFLSSLADSLILLAGVVFLDYLIFFKMRDKSEFQSRAVLMTIAILTCLILRLYLYGGLEDSPVFLSSDLAWWAATFVVLPLAALASKLGWTRKLLEGLAEKSSIFLYIYLPLTLISLVIVILRIAVS